MNAQQAAELYRRQGLEPPADLDGIPRGHKYNARKKEIDGHLFDSTGEAQAYQLLKQWQMAGVISNLELQPVYVLQPKFREYEGKKMHRAIIYIPDFQFQRGGRTVVVDFKGVRTPAFAIKVKMFRQKYPELIFEQWDRQTLRNGGQR